MSEEQKENTDFVVEPLSDDELQDVSGGEVPDGCADGSGCCDGLVTAADS